MKTLLLTIFSILLVCFITAGLFLSCTSKDVFTLDLPFEMSQGLRTATAKLLLLFGMSNAKIEYNDQHVTIAAGRSILLPITQGVNINIQTAIRSTDGSTRIIVGIPALPLDSY